MRIIEVDLDKDDLDNGLTLAIGNKERGMLCYVNVFQYEIGGALEISAIGLPASSITGAFGLGDFKSGLERIKLTFTRPYKSVEESEYDFASYHLGEFPTEDQTCECCGRGTNTVVACKECHELICQNCEEVHICDPK